MQVRKSRTVLDGSIGLQNGSGRFLDNPGHYQGTHRQQLMDNLTPVVLDGIRLSLWIEEAGISRSAAYELLNLTHITPEQRKISTARKPVSFLLPEHLEILQPLAHQLRTGEKTLKQLKGQLTSQINPDATAILKDNEDREEKLLKALEAIAASRNQDFLFPQRQLKEAAENNYLLTTEQVSNITGLSYQTVSKWKPSSKKLGFTFYKEKEGTAVMWRVE